MNEFSDLLRIVHQRRQKGKRLLIDFDAPVVSGSASGKEQRLIDLALAKPASTDLELTKELYQINTPANRAAFRQLRARVQEKLLNNLSFLDYSGEQGLVSRPYEMECRTLLFRAHLLVSEGETRLSARLLHKVLKKAQEADFTFFAEEALTKLALQATDAGNIELYAKLHRQLEEKRARLAAEHRAEAILNRFRLLGSGSVLDRRQFLVEAPALLAELEAIQRAVNSFGTFYSLYRTRIIHAEFIGCYEDVLAIVQHAQQEYDAGRINPKRFDLRFNYFLLIYGHLRTRQFAGGLLLAETYASAFQKSSTNWFFYYESYLLLALHAQRYDLALRLVQQVYENPSFPKIRQLAAERWELLYTYTMLMQPTDVTIPQRRGLRMPLSALTLPEYSRDKSGFNVFIIVYQTLQFLRERRLDAVLLRLERLRKYQQRYLRDSALLRSRTFLRLLLLLPENEFSVPQLVNNERVKQLLQVLRKAPYVVEGGTEIEIIPYEHLWEFTLNILRQGPPA